MSSKGGAVGGVKSMTLGLALAGLVIGGIAGYRSATPAASAVAPSPEADVGQTLTSVGGTVTVHVSGWVARPGLVSVPEGALLAEAIEAAGGALAGARLDLVNLARRVAQGERIEVPGPGSGSASSGTAGDPGDGKVDVNTADETALQQLPGVGPVLAGRIVAHREANGPFRVVEDLLDVPGIGEAKLAAIRDLVVLS